MPNMLLTLCPMDPRDSMHNAILTCTPPFSHAHHHLDTYASILSRTSSFLRAHYFHNCHACSLCERSNAILGCTLCERGTFKFHPNAYRFLLHSMPYM
jgi:hypothetical protein